MRSNSYIDSITTCLFQLPLRINDQNLISEDVPNILIIYNFLNCFYSITRLYLTILVYFYCNIVMYIFVNTV